MFKIGIELEYEGFSNIEAVLEYCADNLLFFRCIEDGSLRDGGIELITAAPGASLPATIEAFENEIENQFFKDFAFIPKKTHRASTHVHINVPSAPLKGNGLFLGLHLFEPYLYEVMPSFREKNIYCIPSWEIYTAWQYRALLTSILYPETTLMLPSSFLAGLSKYGGINFFRYPDINTFEVRMGCCMTSSSELKSWLTLLYELYVFSTTLLADDFIRYFRTPYSPNRLHSLYKRVFSSFEDPSEVSWHNILSKTDRLIKRINFQTRKK